MGPAAAMDPASTPRHRIVDVVLRLVSPDGEPLVGRRVRVEQQRHAFLFGCAGFELMANATGQVTDEAAETAQRLERHWFDLFNAVTLPFYWGWYEPVRGQPDSERLRTTARWFTERGVAVKGHPLCWHTETAPWLLDLTVDEINEAQLARIRREVQSFAGLIDTWDVVNEAVIMPEFDRYPNGITMLADRLGRLGILRETFAAARDANPGATLLINDFDLSSSYEQLIEMALDDGVPIDAIGIQSHMHQGYWGEERTTRILERYARFGLPLHWSETTLLSGTLMPPHIVDLNDWQVDEWPSTTEGEARQAEEAVRHYRTLYGHPAVASITWWGLPDGGWLNAPSGLVRGDGAAKPAFEALRGLIKGDWWLSPTELATDDEGRITFQGTAGSYTVATEQHETTFIVAQDEPASGMELVLGTR